MAQQKRKVYINRLRNSLVGYVYVNDLASKADQIQAIEGVSRVITSTQWLEVHVSPLYDFDEVMDEIEAKLSRNVVRIIVG